MSRFMPIGVLLLTLSPITGSQAGQKVYRCIQPGGQVSFQFSQCSEEGSLLAVEPVEQSGWTELRRGEEQLLEQYQEQEKQRIKKRRKSSPAKKEQKVSYRCWQKRKRLEAVEAKLRRGYRAGEGERLRRQRDNYTEYLELFCP